MEGKYWYRLVYPVWIDNVRFALLSTWQLRRLWRCCFAVWLYFTYQVNALRHATSWQAVLIRAFDVPRHALVSWKSNLIGIMWWSFTFISIFKSHAHFFAGWCTIQNWILIESEFKLVIPSGCRIAIQISKEVEFKLYEIQRSWTVIFN